MRSNPEKGSPTAEPFQGCTLFFIRVPRVLASSNPGLKLANAFGVISNFRDVMIGGSRCGDQGFGCEFFESLVVS
jgi:hypothetical protein